nr:unnamed protein product [Digitaria exilis]
MAHTPTPKRPGLKRPSAENNKKSSVQDSADGETSARSARSSAVTGEAEHAASIHLPEAAGDLITPLLHTCLHSNDDVDTMEHDLNPSVTEQPMPEADRDAADHAQEQEAELHETQKECIQEAENFNDNFTKLANKIHRFPPSLRGLKSYSIPKAVAIGPYHRRDLMAKEAADPKATEKVKKIAPKLKEMEKVKKVAADHFVKEVDRPFLEIYNEVAQVVAVASDFYPSNYVQGIDKKAFEKMMFLDGCFLLQYMFWCSGDHTKLERSLLYFFDTNQAEISNDIMLLENQIPWVVLETLNKFRKDLPPSLHPQENLWEFVAKMGRTFQVHMRKEEKPFKPDDRYRYTPPHLLGLLWHYKTGSHTGEVAVDIHGLKPMSKTVTDIELAEIDIGLKASKTTKFRDMGIKKLPFFTNIFLAPLLLDQVRACWLVNMVAFEVCMGMARGTFRVRSGSLPPDDHTHEPTSGPINQVVCSYLAILAMLMDREEDVHKLREDRIVQENSPTRRRWTSSRLLPST